VILLCSCAYAQDEYPEEEGRSSGGRFLSSLHSFGKGFTDAAEDAEVDYNVEYAIDRVQESPALGWIPLGILIAGLAMNFSPAMVIACALVSFVVMVYFPTFIPAVAIFIVFSVVYHFVLRPDR